jgi:hypothetical protein
MPSIVNGDIVVDVSQKEKCGILMNVSAKVKWWHCDGRISEGKLMAL